MHKYLQFVPGAVINRACFGRLDQNVKVNKRNKRMA
ncbi:hypothetical protein N172_11125 [Pantoea dispersa EGD-AAK13]|nr:hypothetical protein N172_11125 [Pantoea dispersa EGD-AAK13]KAF0856419.1 hypothetical protein Y788_07935 [Pantoea dispersa 625]